MFTARELYPHMEPMHKYLLKEEFVLCEDRPIHKGYWEFCAEIAIESTLSLGKITRDD